MIIEKMACKDVKEVAVISEECFKEIYVFDWFENAESMFKLSDSGKINVLVAKENDNVLGFCNFRSWPAGGWIDLIAVSKNAQNKGIGKKLVEGITDIAKMKGIWKISLIVSENENKTITFYKNIGFEVVGKMKDEIKIGINGVLMSKIVDYKLHPNK